MVRSIQNRILLLLAVIGLSMIFGISMSQRLDRKRIQSLLHKEMAQNAHLLEKVVKFKSKSLENFAYDNTFWDEMVNFVRTGDPKWAYGNIEISIPTFNIDYAWIYRPDLSLVYSVHSGSSAELETLPLPLEELKALASRGPFYNFFIKHGATLIQISGGSIHPSNDPERKTIPSGFLFAGRIWTPGYLKEIGELTGTDLMILDAALSPMRPDSIMQEDFKVINFKSMNGWNNQPQAILSSTGNVEIARTFHHDSRTNLLILAISLVISLAFVSLILIYIINRPLKLLISSLMADDPEPIGKLINQRSEFGHIAGLMSDFFLQKKKLMEEIEERIKIEKELIVAKDKAEESDRLKSAFLNNISHEIRTPMNAIVGFSELIDDPRISEEERSEFTGIIRDSSYRLMGIISDLISLSTVESGQEIINEEAFHLNDFMHGILKKVKSTSNPSDVNIFLDVALKDDHSQIMTDKSKLNQILTHLLRNSVKFTSEGRIDFGYTMRKAEIEFFVKDTGIGIPPDKFETIFAKFQQADDSTSRQFGGAGLGLPISKAYVELLGGQLWLKSIVGEGTQFYFTIPFKTPV